MKTLRGHRGGTIGGLTGGGGGGFAAAMMRPLTLGSHLVGRRWCRPAWLFGWASDVVFGCACCVLVRCRHPRGVRRVALRVALVGVGSGVVLWLGPPLELVPPLDLVQPLEVHVVVLWV